MNKLTNIAIWVLASTTALACSKTPEREPETARNLDEVRGGENLGEVRGDEMAPASRTRGAAEQIARARCEREQQCGNVGADQTYSSSQDCLARIQNDWKDDLDARRCPGGIHQIQLNECLEQIRAESCGNPFDTLARLAECTRGQICVEEP